MKFEWRKSTDNFNTVTVQLMCNNKVLIELVKYENSDVLHAFSNIDFLEFGTGYFEDVSKAKDVIENTLHDFCVEFNTWWQR